MVIVHWVRIHPDPAPGGPAIALSWIPAYAVRQPVYDRFGQLSGLVDPCACQLE